VHFLDNLSTVIPAFRFQLPDEGLIFPVYRADGWHRGLPPTRSRGQRETDRFSGRKLNDGVLHRDPLLNTRRCRNWIKDGAIDLRPVVSIARILISLGGTLAVTKQSLKLEADLINDVEVIA